MSVRLADGSCIETTKKVTLSLKPTQSTQNSLPVDFFVLDSCEPEIIFGMKFLVEREFSCNLRTGVISLDAEHFSVLTAQTNLGLPEQQLLDKTNVFTVNSYFCSESLDRFVSQFKLSNPIFGRIGTFVHSIRLKDTEPVVHKGYVVPISKLEVTRKELARLE